MNLQARVELRRWLRASSLTRPLTAAHRGHGCAGVTPRDLRKFVETDLRNLRYAELCTRAALFQLSLIKICGILSTSTNTTMCRSAEVLLQFLGAIEP